MTRQQLFDLLDYIDAKVESTWNTGPYASARLEKKVAALKENLIASVVEKKRLNYETN